MFTRECLRGEWNSRDAIGTLRRIESEVKLVLNALLKVELVVSSCHEDTWELFLDYVVGQVLGG